MGEYLIDLTDMHKDIEIRDYSFKGASPDGTTLEMNNKYFVKNGEPWYPVMGEFHFSRYPQKYWEESLLKMKAGGVQIVATYVFWIHHEEIRGKYDWSGQRNLAKFIKLCHKCGLYVLLRIGPWAHGECRNGGFPDWLMARNDFKLRSNNAKYFEFVKKFYKNIFKQVKGELFRDGGPIIGVQLENEFGHVGGLRGEHGKNHISTLKKIAQNVGFDVPFYTTTGWGGGIVVDGETIPVQGAYADAPWSSSLKELPKSEEFIFDSPKCDTNIASDLKVGKNTGFTYDVSAYPYLTAELGGGIQVTQHRRPIISAEDTQAMAFTKLGSGANLLGYYMYHGGTNPKGKLSTLQESKVTGYYNDLPEFSYDFQAPIREYGQVSDTYKHLKLLHMFLADFGKEVAQTEAYIPQDSARKADDTENLRIAVRFNKDSGFVFLSNYQRRLNLTDKENLDIVIQNKLERFDFENIKLLNGRTKIMPFNMDLSGLCLLSTEAQPLCRLNKNTYVFWAYEDEEISYNFDDEQIEDIEIKNTQSPLPQLKCVTKDGEEINIYTISKEDAVNSWKVNIKGKEVLLITEADVICDNDMIRFASKSINNTVLSTEDISDILGNYFEEEKYGLKSYMLNFAENKVKVSYKETGRLYDGTKVYEIETKGKIGKEANDLFLNIDFAGESAKLFIKDEIEADWFYTGLTWSIGLKRFKKFNKFRVEVKPLHQKANIYFEKEPQYNDCIACDIEKMELITEYAKIINI